VAVAYYDRKYGDSQATRAVRELEPRAAHGAQATVVLLAVWFLCAVGAVTLA
jgi:hypothetical protein